MSAAGLDHTLDVCVGMSPPCACEVVPVIACDVLRRPPDNLSPPHTQSLCSCRHALPPGYVLKSQMKELLEEEAAKVRDITEVIEEERAKVEAKTTITQQVGPQRGQSTSKGLPPVTGNTGGACQILEHLWKTELCSLQLCPEYMSEQ